MTGDGSEKDYARFAARVLAERTPSTGAAGVIADRAGAIAAIAEALRARRAARTMWRVGFSATAVALAAAGVALALRATNVDPSATLTVTGVAGGAAALETPRGPGAVAAGGRLEPGTRLRAAIGTDLVAALGNGTRVRFSSGAVARVAELGATVRFVLEAGAFAAEVAKLAPDHRFLVVTADADIEVRGTAFEVAVAADPLDCAAGGRTRVVVREGVVVVRRGAVEARVPAGESWPVCPTRAEPRAVTLEPAFHHPPATPAATRGSESTRLHSPHTLASSLAEQNDLFAAALAARRRGDVGEALRWLDRLLTRYPDGQLAASARMERQHLLDGGGPIPHPAAPEK